MKLDQQKQTERAIAKALKEQLPLADLPGVSIEDVRVEPQQSLPPARGFDLTFTLRSGSNSVQVMAEIKSAVSPRMLLEISPWIRRLKALRQDVSVAVVAPVLSPQAQEFCIKNGIDFLDLVGNIFINVPGKFTLQRRGIRVQGASAGSEGPRTINVFGGRSSRVLRVLLQSARPWTITEIARELREEGKRLSRFARAEGLDFEISLGSISKAVVSLEEQLWIRRRGKTILIPEPQRILEQWAEKYKERYRWRLRSSFQTNNPFGFDLPSINGGLVRMTSGAFAFTGAAATSLSAPFVDIDLIDIFITADEGDERLRKLKREPNKGPTLRCIYPYDIGVFMYSNRMEGIPVVSPLQAYLDLYARGGRDLKQAEYLLQTTIQPQWATQ